MFKIPTPFLLYGHSLPSLRPPLPGYVEEMGAPADRQSLLQPTKGHKGESVEGGGGGGGTGWYGIPSSSILPPKLIPR